MIFSKTCILLFLFRILLLRNQFQNSFNHALTPELIFKPMGDKFWLCEVQDLIDGKGNMEKFAIKFHDAETSQDFMNAVQNNEVKICIA